MKSRVLLFFVLMGATVAGAERWWSPDRCYSIMPPGGWELSVWNGSRSSNYAFTSADGESEVRISAAYNLNLPEVLPDRLLEMGFPDEEGLGQIERFCG